MLILFLGAVVLCPHRVHAHESHHELPPSSHGVAEAGLSSASCHCHSQSSECETSDNHSHTYTQQVQPRLQKFTAHLTYIPAKLSFSQQQLAMTTTTHRPVMRDNTLTSIQLLI